MKKKTIISIILTLFFLFSVFAYAETSSSSINWLSKNHADTLYCQEDGTNCNFNVSALNVSLEDYVPYTNPLYNIHLNDKDIYHGDNSYNIYNDTESVVTVGQTDGDYRIWCYQGFCDFIVQGMGNFNVNGAGDVTAEGDITTDETGSFGDVTTDSITVTNGFFANMVTIDIQTLMRWTNDAQYDIGDSLNKPKDIYQGGTHYICDGAGACVDGGEIRSTAGNISIDGKHNIVDFVNNRLQNLLDPENAQDAATKNYVDSEIAGIEGDNLGNHNATQELNMNTNSIYWNRTNITEDSGFWNIHSAGANRIAIDEQYGDVFFNAQTILKSGNYLGFYDTTNTLYSYIFNNKGNLSFNIDGGTFTVRNGTSTYDLDDFLKDETGSGGGLNINLSDDFENVSDTLYFNWTKLNATIDDRQTSISESDPIWVSERYNKVNVTIVWNNTLNAEVWQWGR